MSEQSRPALAPGVSCQRSNHSVDVWDYRWKNNITEWVEKDGNKPMWEYMNAEYFQNLKKSPSEMKVFVPMCGNAVDMLMLYNLGFTVVGVEYSGDAIGKFFNEHSIPRQNNPSALWMSSAHVPNISEDGKIVLMQGDILKCTPETLPYSQFDIIWDRAAFGSINVCDRQAYANLMLSILATDGMHLIDTFEYDQQQFGGPPTHVGQDGLLQYFGDECSITEVNRHDCLQPDHPKRDIMLRKGLTSFAYEVINVMKKL